MKRKERFDRTMMGLLASRPMWGMIPLRVLFGVVLILQGLTRFGFETTGGAIINDLPVEWRVGIITTFAVIEILGGALVIPGIGARFVAWAIGIETLLSILLERTLSQGGDQVYAQLLLFSIALMISFSGAGRYSVDRWKARQLLKTYPSVKQEYYCIAETPYTKWWE